MIIDGKIETDLFAKDVPIFLPKTSCHPPHVFTSIINVDKVFCLFSKCYKGRKGDMLLIFYLQPGDELNDSDLVLLLDLLPQAIPFRPTNSTTEEDGSVWRVAVIPVRSARS